LEKEASMRLRGSAISSRLWIAELARVVEAAAEAAAAAAEAAAA
jgi:hypothetical protein